MRVCLSLNSPTDDEFEETLRKNYSHNIQQSREKQEQMSAFLRNAMVDPNGQQQQRMNEVLLGGRGQQKRLYAVDETIYGTEEGAKLQQAAQDAASMQKPSKAKKRRRRKQKVEKVADAEPQETDGQYTEVLVKQSLVAVALVGAVAAGSMFMGGGKRS
mmetsp:Transcript_20624/g.46628  ORF Transcript_20624/g.46628 Transcript_20624/m.46628 type:complete len:159 (-) Transcript_20624:50-526(-)